jgi:serine/threonine-protein kinase
VTLNSQFRPGAEELYSLIAACMQADPDARPTADEVVSKCEMLCYSVAPREFGTVQSVRNAYWGFIDADHGKSVFYHVQSIFGGGRLKAGERVWFARHRGSPNDRAFPVVRVLAA